MVMMRRFPIHTALFAATLSLGLSACTVFDPGKYGDGEGDIADSDESALLVCQAQLHVTGTKIAPATNVADLEAIDSDGATSCIPWGTWQLNVDLIDQGNCETVPFELQYTYEVLPDPNGTNTALIRYTGENGGLIQSKITGLSGDMCSGTFEHFSPDGLHFLLLKPFERTGAIEGTGSYKLYKTNQL